MTHEYDYTMRKRSRNGSVKGINVISFSVLGLFLPSQCYHGNFKALDNNFSKVSQVNEISASRGCNRCQPHGMTCLFENHPQKIAYLNYNKSVMT